VSTADAQVEFRKLGRGGFAGLVLTLAMHGALAYIVYQSQIKSAPRPEATRDVIITRMVKFEKKREKPWLPRIVEPPPVEAPPPVIKVAENPEAPPAPPPPPPPPKPAPQPEDKNVNKDLQRALKRAQALARAAKEEPEEGPTTGFGDSNENVVGDDYMTAVHDAIKSNWTVPSGLLNDAQLAGLVADVRVSIDADGTLKSASMFKPSGNDLFDSSCVQAVRATGKVPPPPVALRAKYRRGVVIAFEGKSLAR
jgi:protein TonB